MLYKIKIMNLIFSPYFKTENHRTAEGGKGLWRSSCLQAPSVRPLNSEKEGCVFFIYLFSLFF